MKADRNFRRNGSADAEEVFKRATKLAPNRKSGKERHSLYTQFDEEEEDAAFGYKAKQESVLDYYDDGEVRCRPRCEGVTVGGAVPLSDYL